MKTKIDRRKVMMLAASQGIEEITQLAHHAGLHPNTIHKVLDSHNWSARSLDAIANALGCVSTDLLTVDSVDVPVQAALGDPVGMSVN